MKNILKLVGRRHHHFLMRFSQGLSTSFRKSLRKSKNICGSVLYGTKEKGGFTVLISLLILGRIAFRLPFQNYLYNKHSYDTLAAEFVQHLLNGIALCAVSCRHHLRDFVNSAMCSKGNLAVQCSPLWHKYFIEISNLGFRGTEECIECLENTHGLLFCKRKEVKRSVCIPQTGSGSALPHFC